MSTTDAATPKNQKTVRVRWDGTEKLDIPVRMGKHPGKGKRDTRKIERLVFGSTLDRGIVGLPQPELDVPEGVWRQAVKIPAVANLVKDGKLITYG